jgi:peroxiredoxin
MNEVTNVGNAPGTIDGWYALHMLYRVDWARLRALPEEERRSAVEDFSSRMEGAEAAREGHRGSSAFYWLLGHKGDVMAIHLRPTLDALADVENAFARAPLMDCMAPSYSYLSVVELSTHGNGGRAPEAQEALEDALRARLEPDLPAARYACFYPMSKLRGEDHNWYMLTAQERQELMRSHGLIGREYAGKVKQIITGSMGLDDWEWGVDLFADDPLQFKKIVYEMRFDEVSARYALFGAFYVGLRIGAGDLGRYLAI